MTTNDCRRAVTRLAPSPTGALHLGNARTFLVNWAMARQRGWSVLLRIDDLDGPRTKAGADEQAIEVLRWLGLDWDAGPVWQRAHRAAYEAAMETLGRGGWLYPCRCSRREIAEAQSAPHGDSHELRYPGTCRPAQPKPLCFKTASTAIPQVAWRMVVPDRAISFVDQFCGPQTINVQQQVGDFIVATRQAMPAYQLAVVTDDAAAEVTEVVRGDDLLDSTARQLLLYERLGLGPVPRYYHLPMVVGSDGRRLAKRHGDTKIATYRRAGVSAERIIGLIAEWSGMGERREMSADEFVERFDLTGLPRRPVVFTDADDRWLRAAAGL